MANINCSFCGNKMTVEQATQRFIVGPRNVYICRPCVELCVDTFSDSDPAWFEQLIARRGRSR